MKEMAENKNNQNQNQINQINIEISDEVGEGIYSNLAIITHSPAEFIIDFIKMMPVYRIRDGYENLQKNQEVFDRWYGFYGQGLYFPKTHPGKHLNQVMVEQALEMLGEVR